MSTMLECTGERFLPGYPGNWVAEHLHRYLFAAQFVAGKDVLDIASGEGYGSALLAQTARSVVGIDIAAAACQNARDSYPADRLTFLQGSSTALPLLDNSVDIVTSFETLEHLVEHDLMLTEIKRVLRPGGLLIMSSPDRPEYAKILEQKNEYHLRELDRAEFEELIHRYFAYSQLSGQNIEYGSLMASEDNTAPFVMFEQHNMEYLHHTGVPQAVYLVAVASDQPLPTYSHSMFRYPLTQADSFIRAQNMIRELSQQNVTLSEAQQTLQHEHAELHDEYARLQREFKMLHEAFEGKLNELETMTEAFMKTGETLEYTKMELTAALESTKEKLHDTQMEAELLKTQVRTLHNTLDTVYHSHSWRITHPLRVLGAFARSLIR